VNDVDKIKADADARDEEILLMGVTGSTAYGLAHADSDIDRLGIYAVPTERVFDIGWNQGKASRVSNDPDVQLHEIGKYLKLILSGNPTITELLYLNEYDIGPKTDVGYNGYWSGRLMTNRQKLTSTKAVKEAYVSYAVAQANRLANRQENGQKGFNSDLAKRTAKHGRHCFRLLLQAEQLLTEGTITIDVSGHRDELFSMGELAETNVSKFQEVFETRKQEIDNMESVLADDPDYEFVQDFLRKFRKSRLRR